MPFCVVAGSALAMFLVPLLTACITGALVIVSFWPVIVVMLPFFAAGWLLLAPALLLVAWFLRSAEGRRVLRLHVHARMLASILLACCVLLVLVLAPVLLVAVLVRSVVLSDEWDARA